MGQMGRNQVQHRAITFQLTGAGISFGHFSEARSSPVINFTITTCVSVDASASVGAYASSSVLARLLANRLLAELAGVTGPADALIFLARSTIHAPRKARLISGHVICKKNPPHIMIISIQHFTFERTTYNL